MSLGERIIELFAQSVIVQGVLTIGVTAVVCYLAIAGSTVPEELWTLLGLAWGFYFGTKAQMAVSAQSKKYK